MKKLIIILTCLISCMSGCQYTVTSGVNTVEIEPSDRLIAEIVKNPKQVTAKINGKEYVIDNFNGGTIVVSNGNVVYFAKSCHLYIIRVPFGEEIKSVYITMFDSEQKIYGKLQIFGKEGGILHGP